MCVVMFDNAENFSDQPWLCVSACDTKKMSLNSPYLQTSYEDE